MLSTKNNEFNSVAILPERSIGTYTKYMGRIEASMKVEPHEVNE